MAEDMPHTNERDRGKSDQNFAYVEENSQNCSISQLTRLFGPASNICMVFECLRYRQHMGLAVLRRVCVL